MAMKKVFLSSTSRDLAEYREAAYNAIEGLDGYHCVRMENFGASDEGIDDFCRAKVSECNLFVGIIGILFGDGPERSNESYTEREYYAAIDANISRLMFVAPEDFLIRGNLQETQEKRFRQENFRKRVNKEVIRARFTSPEDLASEIITAIHNWERKQRPTRIPHQAPQLPEHIVPRFEESEKLKHRLLNYSAKSSDVLVISAIHGLGGIGKTILATVLAHDPEVKNRFSDGVLWATLGQEPDVLSLLSAWIQALGDYNYQPTKLDLATEHLRTLLQDKSMLLVVDDAWNVSDVEPFLVTGSNCQVLVTTRDSLIASAVGARLFELDVMTEDQSMMLFSNRLGRNLENSEKKSAVDLAKTVGYLPLAIQLAAAQIEDGVPWIRLIEDLQKEVANLKTLEMPGVEEIPEAKRRYYSLKACFKLSLQRLPERLKDNFPWFGGFPEDVLINFRMMNTIWEVDEQTAERDLRYLRNKSLLLSGPLLSETIQTYRLHDLVHDLARNLLTNPSHPLEKGDLPGLGLKIQEGHRIILERYKRKTKGNQWHTIPDDNYIHSHLLWHMEKANLVQEIHNLLREETTENRNAWYEIRDHLGQIGGFMEDVARAWRLAESVSEIEIQKGGQPSGIELEIRYALITASVNSLASNLPSNLLSGMVRTALWTLAQGLAYARQVPDSTNRDETFRRLCLSLQDPQEALVAAREIGDELMRSKALEYVALSLPGSKKTETLKEALAVAKNIRDENYKSEMMADIALNLPEPQDALNVIRRIENGYWRSKALVFFGLNLPETEKMELIEEIFSITKSIRIESQKGEILGMIAPNLSASFLKGALLEAWKIKKSYRRYEALENIIFNLKDPQEAVEIARKIMVAVKIKDQNLKKQALEEIMSNLHNPQEAVAIVGKIKNWEERTEDVVSIAKKLHNRPKPRNPISWNTQGVDRKFKDILFDAETLEKPQKMLEMSRAMGDQQWRNEILAMIAFDRLKPILKEAFEIARKIEDEQSRAEALSRIAANLLEPNEMIQLAREIPEEYWKAETLAKIAPSLPQSEKLEVLKEALDIALRIRDMQSKAEILASIASNMHNPQEILRIAKDIGDEHWRAEVLISIATNMYDPQEILKVAKDIGDENWRSEVLASIAPNLNDPRGMLEVAKDIGDERWKAEALLRTAAKLPEPLLNDALNVANNISSPHWRVKALASIAPSLQETQKKRVMEVALKATKKIKDEHWKAEALAWISSIPSNPIDALEVAVKIRKLSKRAEILAEIGPKLSDPQKKEVLNEAHRVASEINEKYERSKMLAKIAAIVPEPKKTNMLNEALQSALEIDEVDKKVKVLAEISSDLPELQKREALKKVLEITREIGDYRQRAKVLAEIAPLSKEIPQNILYPLWHDTHRILSRRSRRNLLSDLSALIPAIFVLGGTDALKESASAIEDVGRWWP